MWRRKVTASVWAILLGRMAVTFPRHLVHRTEQHKEMVKRGPYSAGSLPSTRKLQSRHYPPVQCRSSLITAKVKIGHEAAQISPYCVASLSIPIGSHKVYRGKGVDPERLPLGITACDAVGKDIA